MYDPVQIYDHGKLVRFRSHALFLRLLGWSQGYTKTPHYRQKYGEETAQQLWDRTIGAHARLMSFTKSHTPFVDPVSGTQSYKTGRVIIYPEGCEDMADPYALAELNAQALKPGEQMPDQTLSLRPASTNRAPVAKRSDGEPEEPAEDPFIAIRILDALDNLFLHCGLAEGTEAAKAFKESITEVKVEQRRVASVNGDAKHWLVEILNKQIKTELTTNNGE